MRRTAAQWACWEQGNAPSRVHNFAVCARAPSRCRAPDAVDHRCHVHTFDPQRVVPVGLYLDLCPRRCWPALLLPLRLVQETELLMYGKWGQTCFERKPSQFTANGKGEYGLFGSIFFFFASLGPGA